MLVAWKLVTFEGTLKLSNKFAIAVQFVSKHNDYSWNLMNIYGPCTHDGKKEFIDWLKSVDFNQEEDCILVGDFNLYRQPENRNRPGADHADTFLFNNTISYLGLAEIPLQGKKYT